MAEVFGFDCYSPRETAERVETVGVAKANLPLLSMTAPGVLAGLVHRTIYRRSAGPPAGGAA